MCLCVTITLHSANYYCLFSLSVVFALAVFAILSVRQGDKGEVFLPPLGLSLPL